jgi:hypothetical protein
MGLVGLMDSPRAGRPRLHDAVVNKGRTRLTEFFAGATSGSPAARKQLLASMNRAEKESLWRSLRADGGRSLRQINGLDLSVPVTPTLQDLISVLLLPSLTILSFLPGSTKTWDGLSGVWVGVPRSQGQAGSGLQRKADLISSLDLDLVMSAKTRTDKQTEKRYSTRDKHLLYRQLAQLTKLAKRWPRKICVCVIANIEESQSLVDVLQHLRNNQLWQNQSSRAPGLLKELRIVPSSPSAAGDIQGTIARYLAEAPEADISKLESALSAKRTLSFLWYRTDDEHEPDNESNWLADPEDPS